MKDQLLATLENSRRYTLQVAEAMPEGSYAFKPVDTVWSFQELLHHIAYGIQWWEENYVKGTSSDWNPPASKGGKKDVIAYLTKAYAALKDTISNAKLTEKEVQGFHATLDHITHHRGQAVTYLRGQGVTPPEYGY